MADQPFGTAPARKYDSTVARIAGNLLSGQVTSWMYLHQQAQEIMALQAVAMARMIVAETKRTEPVADPTEGK